MNAQVIVFDGELDLATVLAYTAQIHRAAQAESNLVLDLSGLTHIGTAGVSMIIREGRKIAEQGRSVILVAPQRSTARLVLEVLQLRTLFPIAESVEEARARA